MSATVLWKKSNFVDNDLYEQSSTMPNTSKPSKKTVQWEKSNKTGSDTYEYVDNNLYEPSLTIKIPNTSTKSTERGRKFSNVTPPAGTAPFAENMYETVEESNDYEHIRKKTVGTNNKNPRTTNYLNNMKIENINNKKVLITSAVVVLLTGITLGFVICFVTNDTLKNDQLSEDKITELEYNITVKDTELDMITVHLRQTNEANIQTIKEKDENIFKLKKEVEDLRTKKSEIKKTIEVCKIFKSRYSPLLIAATKGLLKDVVLSLLCGENIETKDDTYGSTSLLWAAQNGHSDVIQLLLDLGANVRAVNTHGESSLFIASRGGHQEVVKMILNRVADSKFIDQKEKNHGYTALIIAVKNGHVEIVKELLKKGANTDVTDNKWFSAVDYANKEGIVIAQLLKNHINGWTI